MFHQLEMCIGDNMIMPNSPDRKGYFGISYDKPDVAGGDLWVYYGYSFQSESWNRTWQHY